MSKLKYTYMILTLNPNRKVSAPASMSNIAFRDLKVQQKAEQLDRIESGTNVRSQE
jgi:hypothetical protein